MDGQPSSVLSGDIEWVQVRDLIGPSGFVHRVIVLLEGEPLTQSEVLGTPKLILIRFIFILSLLQLFFKPDQSLILKNTPTQ